MHVVTIIMEAIIISITAVLLKEDMDSVFSTLTIYLVLSGISTVANFGISERSLRRSMGEVRPLQPFKLSWLRMSGSTRLPRSALRWGRARTPPVAAHRKRASIPVWRGLG